MNRSLNDSEQRDLIARLYDQRHQNRNFTASTTVLHGVYKSMNNINCSSSAFSATTVCVIIDYRLDYRRTYIIYDGMCLQSRFSGVSAISLSAS